MAGNNRALGAGTGRAATARGSAACALLVLAQATGVLVEARRRRYHRVNARLDRAVRRLHAVHVPNRLAGARVVDHDGGIRVRHHKRLARRAEGCDRRGAGRGSFGS